MREETHKGFKEKNGDAAVASALQCTVYIAI
jgi:hypothetical protein